MAERSASAPDFAAIADNLELLASESRLELLHALRTPKPLNELRVGASRTRRGENPERAISRQAITHHLDLLQHAGLVERLADAHGRGERFVLNHERLFALVDEMRGLARLRSVIAPPADVGETIEGQRQWELRGGPRPRLALAYGRDDGITFQLTDQVGARWRLGRSSACEIVLDYDPFLSSVHCTLERDAEGFVLRDEDSRNGTWLNWDRVEPERTQRLASGDLITAGRSILAFQP